jgi:hypothetical protein
MLVQLSDLEGNRGATLPEVRQSGLAMRASDRVEVARLAQPVRYRLQYTTSERVSLFSYSPD